MTIVFKKLRGDRVIWAVALLLALVSILVVYSSTGVLAYYRQHGNTEYYLFKHSLLLITGFLLMYFTQYLDYRWFAWLSELGIYFCVPLLVYTLIFGISRNEANRWINIPVINSSFQPSDLARLILITYLARTLAKRQENVKNFRRGFLPIIFWVILICGLIAPWNLSTSLLIFITSLVVLVFGRVRFAFISGLIITGLLGISILLFFGPRRETYKTRIENFVNQENQGYQVEQSKIAIASGGMFGKGPGKSVQRNYLPQPYNDFVYAIIIEEYGMFGGIIVMLLYLLLLLRGIGIATLMSDKPFGALLSAGLTFSLVFQAMVNIAVTVNLLPVTGISLPMISMGGTSVIFTCITLGIILSVSRESLEKTYQERPINDQSTSKP